MPTAQATRQATSRCHFVGAADRERFRVKSRDAVSGRAVLRAQLDARTYARSALIDTRLFDSD